MKILHKILIVLSLLVTITLSMYYDAFYAAPSRYKVRYETLSSVFIPKQLDDISILFFTDLDYGQFMNQQRLAKLVNTINDLSPDIIIFGGDMFDQSVTHVTSQQVSSVQQFFKQLNAPLGKFAVLGDLDQKDTDTLEKVRNVLYQSDFELLENTSILLRNGGSESITLIGINDGLTGTQNITSAFANVSKTSYQIAVCHTPDSADLVPTDLTKYMLSGHSHGGQVFYGFGALYTPAMAEKYLFGLHRINTSFTLDISSGVGTTIQDVRFLANAEVVLYRLKNKEATIKE